MQEEIAAELAEMVRIDQDAVLDPKVWQEFVADPDGAKKHTARLKQIIAEFGWPTITKFGPIASDNAWLITQHSDYDLEFQQKVLELLKSLPAGEVDKVNIAYLEDRVRMNQGKPQLYGTQWVVEGDKQVPYQIDNPEQVEERRAAMGLGTMEDNLKKLQAWSKMATEKLKAKE